ncbi:MAG: Helix-turn-helix domain [Clostridia bacterium]|jgi:excisionase family DNA binding protein|nr:Helix-turn-helix domain [Clostridia bacterium]
MNTETQKLILNAKEAAEYLGIAKNTLAKLLNSGEIKFVRVDRRILITIEALNKWLQGESK